MLHNTGKIYLVNILKFLMILLTNLLYELIAHQKPCMFVTTFNVYLLSCPPSLICFGYQAHALQSCMPSSHLVSYTLLFFHHASMVEIVFAQKKFRRPYYI